MTGNSGALAVRTNSFRERSPQNVVGLHHCRPQSEACVSVWDEEATV
jgi:hypothetical protein